MTLHPGPAALGRRRALDSAPLLVAARGGAPSRLPVWFMRQAGRSLPEYRALRAGTSMLAACLTPELVCEITLQPVRRHGVDAAILFSDIVVPLYAAGVGVDIVPGTGPVLAEPVRTLADVQRLPSLHPGQVAPVTDAIALLLSELDDTPLIGFAGAPFTLASYVVEGGPSRNHERTKALMRRSPEVWHALMDRLATVTETFLRVQVAAGVDAVQLFDSWAGALSERDYRHYVLPYSARVLGGLAEAGVPRIHLEWAPESCSGRWPRPAPTWSVWTGGCRWTWRPGASAAPGRCRETWIRPCCSPIRHRSRPRPGASPTRAVALRGTCSTSATACSRRPIRTCSPGSSSWCTA